MTIRQLFISPSLAGTNQKRKTKAKQMDSGFRRNDGAIARSMNKNVGTTPCGCPPSDRHGGLSLRCRAGQGDDEGRRRDRSGQGEPLQGALARRESRVRYRSQGHARPGPSASPNRLIARVHYSCPRSFAPCSSPSYTPAASEIPATPPIRRIRKKWLYIASSSCYFFFAYWVYATRGPIFIS